jgi:hypothetical protein
LGLPLTQRVDSADILLPFFGWYQLIGIYFYYFSVYFSTFEFLTLWKLELRTGAAWQRRLKQLPLLHPQQQLATPSPANGNDTTTLDAL